MFIGREQELGELNRLYKSERLEVAIMYGRRRVGKTELINYFCKGKKSIFFTAIETGIYFRKFCQTKSYTPARLLQNCFSSTGRIAHPRCL